MMERERCASLRSGHPMRILWPFAWTGFLNFHEHVPNAKQMFGLSLRVIEMH
jgi:hypothetical protein